MAETGGSPLPPQPRARSALSRAERFVRLTARVLEQRRFAHHFLGGGAEAVDTALAAYRNEDGGYGHGLDPGLRGPASRPPHAGHALRVLDSIGLCGGQRAERLCRYLASVSTSDGALPAAGPGDRPHGAGRVAPAVGEQSGGLLATGPAVGLLHRNEVWHAWLFRATDFCWQAVESLERPRPDEAEAAVAFLDAVPDRRRAEAAAGRLGRLVRAQRLVARVPEGPQHPLGAYGTAQDGLRLPYHYARTPRSLARAWFTDEEVSRALDFLEGGQQEDGGWPFPSRSPAREDRSRGQWSPGVVLEVRPIVTVEALRTLRAYGRPLGRPAPGD